MKNAIIFGGSGGGGLLTMGNMLARCALDCGKHVSDLPSYTGVKRGGFSSTLVVIDDREILSPMAELVGVFVAMDIVGYKKFIDSLEPGGILFYDSSRIPAESVVRTDIKVIAVPASDIAAELGAGNGANIVMLGVLVGLTGIVPGDVMAATIDKTFRHKSEKVRDMNALSFRRGLEIAGDFK